MMGVLTQPVSSNLHVPEVTFTDHELTTLPYARTPWD